MSSAALVGCTGLVGSQILRTLLDLSQTSVKKVTALTRKPLPDNLPDPHSMLNTVVNSDSSEWPTTMSATKPSPAVFISALGTTRAIAGSFAAQRAIDIDLNLSLARAVKEAGARFYVLISSAGVSSSSPMPYAKMKGELEDQVRELGFEKTVIVKPGLLVGPRVESRPPEAALRHVAQAFKKINRKWMFDTWAQDVDVIGNAVVKACLMCLDGTAPEGKVWTLQMKDITKLGRDEWTA